MVWYGQVCTLLLVLQGCRGINRTNTVMYADIEDTVVLVCVDNRQTTSCTWRRNDKLLSDGRTINHFNNDTDNISIVGDPSIGECNLKISNLTSNDFGCYTCEAGNANEMNVIFVKKDIEELTTNLEEYSTTQSTIKSTFANHTKAAKVDVTTNRVDGGYRTIHEYETPVDKDIKDLITDMLNPEVQLDNKSLNEHALNDYVDIAVELQNGEQMIHDANTQQNDIS